MTQRIYLVVDTRRGIQLSYVRTVYFVPRKCLSSLDTVCLRQGFTYVEVDIEVLNVDLTVGSKRNPVNAKKCLTCMRD